MNMHSYIFIDIFLFIKCVNKDKCVYLFTIKKLPRMVRMVKGKVKKSTHLLNI